jgi:glycosyltransferase involved in cell wall biosynthesis
MLFKLTHRLLSAKYDIIHVVDWPSLIALEIFNFFRKNKKKYIVTLHGTDIFVLKELLKKYPFLKGIVFQNVLKIHYNSQYTKNLASQEIPFLIEGIPQEVHYLGVNSIFFKEENLPDIYTKYKIPKNRKIILSVSRLDKRKGHLDAIEALSLLDESIKQDIIYIIIGKKIDDNYFNSVIKKLEKTNIRYLYLGTVDIKDLIAFYKNSYVFFLPGFLEKNKAEGFGLVYLEAAAQKLPSVAYNIYAIPEVVKDGETGFLANYRNISELSQKLKKLLGSSLLRKEMGEKARRWARNFTWEKCVGNLYSL